MKRPNRLLHALHRSASRLLLFALLLAAPAWLAHADPTPTPTPIPGVKATATSELATHGRIAANAVNGVHFDTSFWESVGVGEGFGTDRDPAITFDLGAVHTLDQLLIWNSHEAGAAVHRMVIELSVDGVTYTPLSAEVTVPGNLAAFGSPIPLSRRVARYVRFDILENGSGVTFPIVGNPSGWSLVALDEVEFFGVPGGTEVPVTEVPGVGGFHDWYRADSAQFAGLAEGQAIPEWRPEPGSASSPVTVQTAGQEIVYRRSVAELNGKPALEFPGGKSFVRDVTKIDYNGFSAFLVFRNQGTGASQRAVAGLDSNTLLGPWSPGGYPPSIHLNGVWKLHPADLPGWVNPSTCVLGIVIDAGSTEKSFVNGTEIDTTHGNPGPMDTTGIGRLSFGGSGAQYEEAYRGYLAEFVIFRRALAADEIGKVHEYLLAKYGLRGPVDTVNRASDDFNDGSVDPLLWNVPDDIEGGATLLETAQRLEYRVASPDPAGFDAASRTLASRVLVPTRSDWEVTVDVHHSAITTGQGTAAVGIQLAHPTRDQLVFLELYATGATRGFVTGLDTDGNPVGRDGDTGPLGTQNGSLRLRFEGATRVVTAFYDADGPANGPQWRRIGSYGLAGAGGTEGNADWSLPAEGNLVLALGGYSEGTAVPPGAAYLDNFLLVPEASSPIDVPPTITLQPLPQSVFVGQDATFVVAAAGTPPFEYQWLFTPAPGGSEVPVPSATQATLLLKAVTLAQAGSYRARVTHAASPTAVFSSAGVLAVKPRDTSTVTRILPGSYVPGKALEVVLESKPAPGVAFHAVADRPPAGWTVSAVNESGVLDPRTGQVKFGPFSDNLARTLRYTVLPPANATTRAEFVGILSTDGSESAVAGDASLEPTSTHPADLDVNLLLGINEATGYGAAWKQGATWTVPPVPIPVNYVTRAGFLWRNGEKYRLDPAAGAAPLWWVPDTSPSSPSQAALHGPAPASGARRALDGARITLQVVPANTVQAQAIEEILPYGFTATELSHGGTYLPAEGRVRWGPFFDHDSRLLSYRIAPPAGFAGELALRGVFSADGTSEPVGGERLARFGTGPLPPPIAASADHELRHLDIAGPVNAEVTVESTLDLALPWEVLGEFRLERSRQRWSAPAEYQDLARFFRVRVVLAP